MGKIPTREEAWALLTKYNKEKTILAMRNIEDTVSIA